MDLTEQLKKDSTLTSIQDQQGKVPRILHNKENVSKPTPSHQLKRILRPKLAIRLVAICLLGCITAVLIYETTYWMGAIWTGLATVALFYEKLSFVDRS